MQSLDVCTFPCNYGSNIHHTSICFSSYVPHTKVNINCLIIMFISNYNYYFKNFYRNFKKVFQDLVLSRRAIHNMNTLYPDATAQDFIAIENVCIICREDMTTAGNLNIKFISYLEMIYDLGLKSNFI